MIVPNTLRLEWATDKDGPCAHTVSPSSGRGTAAARALLPFIAGKTRPALDLRLLDVPADLIASEVAGGHEFEIDVDTKIRWQALDNTGYQLGGASRGIKETIHFATIPAADRLRFQLPAGLLFAHQPALTQADHDLMAGGGILYRPEHVVHSWAVWHQGVKIAHIFRLRITDADGKWMWLDDALSYDPSTGVLVVQLPLQWMKSAEHHAPFELDPTFGYENGGTPGGTTFDGLANREWYYQASIGGGTGSPASDGTIDSMSVYTGVIGSGSGYTIGLWKESDSNKLADSNEITIPGSEQWMTDSNFTESVLAAEAYYLGANSEAGHRMRYDTGGAGNNWEWDATAYAAGNLSASIAFSAEYDADTSIYVTYSPADGGVSIPVAMRTYRNRRVA